jgi:hypothetical protein
MDRKFVLRTSVLIGLFVGSGLQAQTRNPPPTLVVVNQIDHDISLVDPVAERQIAKVNAATSLAELNQS